MLLIGNLNRMMNPLFVNGNKKGEGFICLHLFTTGNITRHFLAVVYCVCFVVLR